MPGMSGLELLPKAKALRPDVPVVTITAYVGTGPVRVIVRPCVCLSTVSRRPELAGPSVVPPRRLPRSRCPDGIGPQADPKLAHGRSSRRQEVELPE